jgi:hypothetical protein
VLGYTAADVDDLSVSDFLALCHALEVHHQREREAAAEMQRGA